MCVMYNEAWLSVESFNKPTYLVMFLEKAVQNMLKLWVLQIILTGFDKNNDFMKSSC